MRYTFFVDGSPNDSVSVTLKYSAGPTIGVNENEVAVAKSYPNPASDAFFVEFADQPKSNTSIEVYNLLGTKVKQVDVTSMRTEINVSNLTSGIYIYTVSRNGKTFETKKVVVKH